MVRSIDGMDWTELLIEQADWHWQAQLRPRLAGLTDEEYFWEPVAGAWSLRPRGTSKVARTVGGGEYVFEFEWPAPDPAPVTTIAWRIGHLVVNVFGLRVAAHFGGPALDYNTFQYAGDAATALEQLDANYQAWYDGVRTADLSRPAGPAEGPYADNPMATLVLHINRELIHHGAEIALLRDLYRWR
jgi:hypothetical protein